MAASTSSGRNLSMDEGCMLRRNAGAGVRVTGLAIPGRAFCIGCDPGRA
jgi:hypothetical protein